MHLKKALFPKLSLGLAAFFLTAWVILDSLWLNVAYQRAEDTLRHFWGKSLHEKKLSDWDGKLYGFISLLENKYLLGDPGRVAIISATKPKHYLLRARLHLMYSRNSVYISTPPFTLGQIADDAEFIIVLNDQEADASAAETLRTIGAVETARIQLVFSGAYGSLFRVLD